MSKLAIKRIQLRTSMNKAFRVFVFVFATLALPTQSLAQGDDTNAANITSLSLWASMYQVMGGTSKKTPDQLTSPSPLNIRTPQGIYPFVMADTVNKEAETAAASSGMNKDTLLGTYFTFLLSQQEVAGLLFAAPWSLLNPNDPASDPSPYDWSTLDDAIAAITNWNTTHSSAKTLQLGVSPGFNSPQWLFQPEFVVAGPAKPLGYLTSCDGLFVTYPLTPPPPPIHLPILPNPEGCGYTYIFTQTEVANPGPARLPMPWNPIYKSKWKAFLIALREHIKSQKAEKYVVSIGVGGPTASSSEIILPNERGQKAYTPLTLYWTPLEGIATTPGITATSAWNCLLANNYGRSSSYLNSDRAFVEEWAAAIDMFGEVFSGLTLIVTTGNGLPDFADTSVPGCGLSGISLPNASTPGYAQLSNPHPAFLSDCGNNPGTAPLFPMDCAAEVAILAYFAEPSVGGPNAKATNEAALAASDDVVKTLLSLSNASVKWLAWVTAGGLTPMSGAVPGTRPVMSRMLGGLQLAKPFSDQTIGPAGYSPMQAEGCSSPPPCPTQTPPVTTPEQALLNVLQNYFAGTSGGGPGAFAAQPTITNNFTSGGVSVSNAPLNYLQFWADDIKYAAGYGQCTDAEIMTTWSPTATMPPCYKKQKQPMPVVNIGITPYTAQGLLNLASMYIPTTTPVALPLFGYDSCNNKVPTCQSGYYPRGAFDGDLVCVSQADQTAAQTDTKDGRSTSASKNHYTTNATDYSIKPVVPYGLCDAGYAWRQGHMGDYVCVSSGENGDQGTVASDNGAGASRVNCP